MCTQCLQTCTHILYNILTHLQTCDNANRHTHINQRSAGSRIAASLHQGLNINVGGAQISSRGNPFKAILLCGWCFCLIYAHLCKFCFNLNQCVCVWNSLKASIKLTASVHVALSLCLPILICSPCFSMHYAKSFLGLASPVQKGAAVGFSSKYLDFYSTQSKAWRKVSTPSLFALSLMHCVQPKQ